MVSFPSPDDTLTSLRSGAQIPIEARKVYSDSEIHQIASLLRRMQQPWRKVPRTYIVLRSLDRLDLLNEFIDIGFTDRWFPVEPRNLPATLNPSVKSQFAKAQQLVLAKAVDLEKEDRGEHCNFARGEPLPFTFEQKLGSGGFSQVDKVISLISYKEYALKRIRRQTWFGNRSVEGMKRFAEEVNIIKRMKHWHFVEFVGIYIGPPCLVLLTSPVADMDLVNYPENALSIDSKSANLDLRSYFGCLATALQYLYDKSNSTRMSNPKTFLLTTTRFS